MEQGCGRNATRRVANFDYRYPVGRGICMAWMVQFTPARPHAAPPGTDCSWSLSSDETSPVNFFWMEGRMDKQKKQYREPKVEDWGTVADLTANGQTFSGGDPKEGSNSNTQGQ